MDYLQELTDAGLTPHEATTYTKALELGPCSYATLSRATTLERATLYYAVLPSLVKKGLIAFKPHGKRKLIVAQDLKEYIERKKHRLAELEEMLPQLNALLSAAKVKPTILVYEGIEGIKKIWHDHLTQKEPLSEFIGIENIHPELQKYVKEHYIWERAKRKIPVRMLLSGPRIAGVFNVKSDSYELRDVRTIDGKLFPIPLGLDVYGETVTITLHRKDSEPVGIIIRSREIAQTMHSLFEYVWRGSKK